MLLDEINKIIDDEYTDIFFDDKEKVEIMAAREGLISKGIEKYKLAAELMHEYYPDTLVTYSNVSKFYRFDQRINDNFIKYFNAVEEFIRARLCFICKINEITTVDLNNDQKEKTSACIKNSFDKILNEKTDLRIIGAIFNKICKSKDETGNISVFKFFELLDFGTIKDFILMLKEEYRCMFDYNNLDSLKNMRNNTHHNRFIQSIYSLDECLEAFKMLHSSLPGKEDGNDYKSRFLKCIENINNDKKNIFFEPADSHIKKFLEGLK